jgi:hypothetical protein
VENTNLFRESGLTLQTHGIKAAFAAPQVCYMEGMAWSTAASASPLVNDKIKASHGPYSHFHT